MTSPRASGQKKKKKILEKSEKQRIANSVLPNDLRITTKNLKEEILERKQAELVVKKSEEKFRTLIENLFEGILINDINGNFLYANSRAADISGYTIAELLKLNVKDLTPSGKVSEVEKRIAGTFSGELSPNIYESIMLCKNGEEIQIDLSVVQTIWQGEPAEIVSMRDTTEHKQLEQQLL